MPTWSKSALAWGIVSCVLAAIIVILLYIVGCAKRLRFLQYLELIIDLLVLGFGVVSVAFFTKRISDFELKEGQWWEKYLVWCVLMWISVVFFIMSFTYDLCKINSKQVNWDHHE